MKRNKLIYWISTGLLSVMMVFSGVAYFTDPKAIEGFQNLGFPSYFRIELGIAKILGAIVLIAPFIPALLKNFTYAGFAIVFASAFITHLAIGDPFSTAAAPLIFLAVSGVSFYFFHKLQSGSSAIVDKSEITKA